VLDAHTLLIADAPGNNRLDTLENIVRDGAGIVPALRQGADALFPVGR
jgi:predicted pyridoxine 5'-phosphate oxidase superfamily flavin-nucleotide-binding protein